MPEIKPGLRLKSAVCDGEAMVVKGDVEGVITCGGAPMLGPGEEAPADAQADQAELANLGQQAGFLAGSLEASQRHVEGLVFLYLD